MISDQIIKSVLNTAISVGDYVAQEFVKPQQIAYKDTRNPQTSTDVQAESLLVNELSSLLPEAGFIREEGATSRGKRYNWVIDPIDGTKYFSTHCPLFVVQIALLDGEDIVFSAIYQPIAKQMFHAVKGAGAYLNGTPIHISPDGDLQSALVNLELGQVGADRHKVEVLTKLVTSATRVHLISGVLAPYLLTNTIQAYVKYCGVTPLYDITPRLLLFEEAGATILTTDYHGIELMVVAHKDLAEEIMRTITRA